MSLGRDRLRPRRRQLGHHGRELGPALAEDKAKRSKRARDRPRRGVEVRKPTMFGELIIMIVYLPILTSKASRGSCSGRWR
jgi:Cu/Ag efflux pump CusA